MKAKEAFAWMNVQKLINHILMLMNVLKTVEIIIMIRHVLKNAQPQTTSMII